MRMVLKMIKLSSAVFHLSFAELCLHSLNFTDFQGGVISVVQCYLNFHLKRLYIFSL